MCNSYDVFEIDNYVISSTLQTYHFREYSIFVYQLGLKHAEPNIEKIFETNIIFDYKISLSYLEYCKKFNFYFKNMIDLK